ncbi:ATP-binding protein [Flexibacterium corallicola]|uniref:ATP-binding protein n=1 Tax=Flexibacterium corallicola TaxID=3037259 RepID=UPI00286F953F|nr:ATP-binding protein [Pseudovibrio sp. M1P-2-3]
MTSPLQSDKTFKELITKLNKLVDLAILALPTKPKAPIFSECNAFLWMKSDHSLKSIPNVNQTPIDLLCAVEHCKTQLLANTTRFANGYSANNVLLWGARGMGKSSLIKACHTHINQTLSCSSTNQLLKLVEIHREDIEDLPILMDLLRSSPYRFIVFCDDLSFDGEDSSYKSLKAALEGGIEGRPENVLFYATSNRRHLIPRDMIENERSTAIHPSEAIEEKISLSDRFGLWIGFHNCSQEDYLQMVSTYANHFGLDYDASALKQEALEWSITRGSRSGRVAWQFIQDLAGRLEVKL